MVVIGAATAAAFRGFGFDPFGTQQVGLTYANGVLLPTNQWISPLGTRILDNQERLVSSTLSPDGTYVAALGWNEFSGSLTIINLKTQTIVDHIGLATPGAPEDDFSVAADGPLFSSDGTTLWVPQSTFLLRFSFDPYDRHCDADGCDPALRLAAQLSPSATRTSARATPAAPSCPRAWPTPRTGRSCTSPSTVPTSLPSSTTRRYHPERELDDSGRQRAAPGRASRPTARPLTCPTRVGDRPRPAEFTNLSDGTPIVSSKSTGAAITGTVSVVNLTSGAETQEIPVGLQPTALYQDGATLFVANSNDDSLSVIDERDNQVTQTVDTNPIPGAESRQLCERDQHGRPQGARQHRP